MYIYRFFSLSIYTNKEVCAPLFFLFHSFLASLFKHSRPALVLLNPPCRFRFSCFNPLHAYAPKCFSLVCAHGKLGPDVTNGALDCRYRLYTHTHLASGS